MIRTFSRNSSRNQWVVLSTTRNMYVCMYVQLFIKLDTEQEEASIATNGHRSIVPTRHAGLCTYTRHCPVILDVGLAHSCQTESSQFIMARVRHIYQSLIVLALPFHTPITEIRFIELFYMPNLCTYGRRDRWQTCCASDNKQPTTRYSYSYLSLLCLYITIWMIVSDDDFALSQGYN